MWDGGLVGFLSLVHKTVENSKMFDIGKINKPGVVEVLKLDWTFQTNTVEV